MGQAFFLFCQEDIMKKRNKLPLIIVIFIFVLICQPIFVMADTVRNPTNQSTSGPAMADFNRSILNLTDEYDQLNQASAANMVSSMIIVATELYIDYLENDRVEEDLHETFRDQLLNAITGLPYAYRVGIFRSFTGTQLGSFKLVIENDVPQIALEMWNLISDAGIGPDSSVSLREISDSMRQLQGFNNRDDLTLTQEQYLNMLMIDHFFNQTIGEHQEIHDIGQEQLQIDIDRHTDDFFLTHGQGLIEDLTTAYIPDMDVILDLAEEYDIHIDDLNLVNAWQVRRGECTSMIGDFGFNIPPAQRAREIHTDEIGPAMQDSWLAMFAATAVHVPFVSKVKDADFMHALTHIYPHNEESILSIAGQVLQFSKPLYAFCPTQMDYGPNYSMGASRIDYDGPVQRLTLGDVMHAVSRGGTVYAGVLPGRFVSTGEGWFFKNHHVERVPAGRQRGGESLSVVTTSVPANHHTRTPGVPVRAVLEIRSDESTMFGRGSWLQSVTNLFMAPDEDLSVWTNPSPGHLTAGILTNIYLGLSNRSAWELRSTEILFINPIGDIHLSDGTIILPAAANPVFQANPSFNDGRPSNLAWYNPFTVAVMNNYPIIEGMNTHPSLRVLSHAERWHFIHPEGSPASISPSNRTPVNPDTFPVLFVPIGNEVFVNHYISHLVDGIDEIHLMPGFQLWTNFYLAGHMLTFNDMFRSFTRPVSLHGALAPIIESGYQPIGTLGFDVGDGFVRVFPFAPNDTEAVEIIAYNMWSYVRTRGSTQANSGTGRIRETFMFYHVLYPTIHGTTNTEAFFRHSEFQRRLLDDMHFASNAVFSVIGVLLDFVGNVTTFIGIPTSGDYTILTIIYQNLIRFWYIISVFILVIFIVVLVRSTSLIQALMSLGVIVIGIWGFLFILPRALPIVTAPFLIPFATDMVTNAVIVRAEQPLPLHGVRDENEFSVLLSEMSMYRAQRFHTDNFMTGRVDLIPQIGIYLQGTQLRMRLDTWFRYNEIYVEHVHQLPAEQLSLLSPLMRYEPEPFINNFQIHVRRPHPNPDVIHYYAPLQMMHEGLINTLNRFLKNFRVSRSFILDDQGNVRSAYILPSFVHSYPFLSVLPEVQGQLMMTEGPIDFNDPESNAHMQALILRYFPYPGDILNLQWLVHTDWWDLPHHTLNTVWIQSMIHNGFYDPNVGARRRQFLVNTTNDAAYAFLVRNSRHIGVVTDDIMIKMTALYATMVFNRQISAFGTQVYPQYFTLSDLSVRDILHSSILQNSGRFVFYDLELMHNIYVTRGLIGLISLFLLALAMAVIGIINTLIFPILYVAMVLLLIIMMLMQKNVGGLLLTSLWFILLNIVTNICGMLIFAIYRVLDTQFDIHFAMALMIALSIGVVIAIIKILKNVQLSSAPDILGIETLIARRDVRRRSA